MEYPSPRIRPFYLGFSLFQRVTQIWRRLQLFVRLLLLQGKVLNFFQEWSNKIGGAKRWWWLQWKSDPWIISQKLSVYPKDMEKKLVYLALK